VVLHFAGLACGSKLLVPKNKLLKEYHKLLGYWTDFFLEKLPKLRKMEKRFVTWHVRSYVRRVHTHTHTHTHTNIYIYIYIYIVTYLTEGRR
jgi:hypothetical protein